MTSPASPVPSLADNPAPRLVAHYRAEWAACQPQMSEANPALSVEAIGFAPCAGDWLGVIISPAFLRMILVPGGGRLWGDIPAGQRRYVELPGGTLPFVALDDDVIGPCQYSALVGTIGEVADMDMARRIAGDALRVFVGWAQPAEPAIAPLAAAPGVSRRGFFRRLVGKH